MINLLIVLIIIAAILLVIIVLAQNPKGGGLAQGFSSSNQIMGVQNTNSFLTKATWSLIGFIAVASIIIAGVSITSAETSEEGSSSIIESIQTTPAEQAETPQAPISIPAQAAE